MSGPAAGAERPDGLDRMRALRTLAMVVLLVLGVAWTFRELIGESPTQTAPINSVTPYMGELGDQRAMRLANGTDQRFVVWLFARNARTWLTRPWAMFDAEICHPEPQSLALGEPALSLGLIATPAWLVSGDPVFVFNFVAAILPVIAGLAMFLLIRDWTGNDAAAATAAVLYGLHVVKLSDVVHPYLSDTAWTVLALLFFRRWMASGRWRDVLGLAAAVTLQIGGSLYALIGAASIGGAVAIYAFVTLGVRRTRPAQWGVLALVIGLSAYAAFGPFIAKSLGGTLSERPIQVFLPWATLLPGGSAAPGWVMLLLVLAAFVPFARRDGVAEEHSSWSPRWALLASVSIVLVLAAGGNEGDRLVAQLTGGAPPSALPNPYHWLAAVVPGLSAVRAPVWVASSAHTALCVLAGLGAARLLSRVPPRFVAHASLGAVAVAFAYTLRLGLPDSHAYLPQPMAPPDHLLRFYAELEDEGDDGPLLELPVENLGLGRGSMSILMSAYHHRRTSRCYNSFFSEGLQAAWDLSKGLPDPEVVAELSELGFSTIVIHHPPRWTEMLALVEQIDATADEPGAALVLLNRNPVMSAYRIVAGAGENAADGVLAEAPDHVP